MKKEELAHLLGDVEEEYIREAAASGRKRKGLWLRWGTLVACLCLILGAALLMTREESAEGDVPRENDGGPILTAAGVYIPPMQISLSVREMAGADMLAFFLYGGRCYVREEWLENDALAGEYLGTATGLIDEWTPEEGYVELAGSVEGDFYALEGYDPGFMLGMKEPDGSLGVFVAGRDITLQYGRELFADRLRMGEGCVALDYETRESWFYSRGEVKAYAEDEASEAFLAALNDAAFLPWNTAVERLGEDPGSVYDREIYHVYYRMASGLTVHLRLYEGGYVRCEGIPGACVRLPETVYAAFVGRLEG